MFYVVIVFFVLESGCYKNFDLVLFMNVIFEEEKIILGSILDIDFDNGFIKLKLNIDIVEIYGFLLLIGLVEILLRF